MIGAEAKANPNFCPDFTQKSPKNGPKSGKFQVFFGLTCLAFWQTKLPPTPGRRPKMALENR
jgi:hypothetical protein